MTSYFVSCGLVVIAGLAALVSPTKRKGAVYTFFSGAAAFFAFIPALETLITGNELVLQVYLGFPLGFVSFGIDALSAFFILIISIGNFLVGLYSIGYVKTYAGKKSCSGFFFFLSLLFASMLLITAARSVLAFCILWEIMSLSSFFLVAYEHEKKEAVDSAVYYLVAMQLGFVFILLGFIIVSLAAGSSDFVAFKDVFAKTPGLAFPAFILFFVGFGTKAGFWPFHTWLPKAHPNAPTPVSAAMSGIMIKIGIYGILRIITMIGKPDIVLSVSVLIVSVFTAFWGVMHAIAQTDLKRLLAFSSIENIGIIGIGMGLGMIGLSVGNPVVATCGFAGAALHVANHFLFKSLLFFGAGSVYIATHTRNIEHLGGIAKVMPATTLFFLVGSVAISGLPPLNGFVGELAIYLGFVKGLPGSSWYAAILFIFTIAGLALAGALALFCFTRAYGIVFAGLPRSDEHKATRESSLFMLIPMAILSLAIAGIGIFPDYILRLIQHSVLVLAGPDASASALDPLHASFTLLSRASLVLFAFLAGALLIRFLLLIGKKSYDFKTWDCGYQSGSARIQYTATSFASIIQTVFSPLNKYKVDTLTDERKHSTYNRIVHIETGTKDVTEQYFVRPGTQALAKILKFFHWMQSGNTQQYILYGILFLVILIVVVFGVKI
jgi:hydrogenase-4 component B